MRQITDHVVPGDSANHQVRVIVRDEPGAGGACHRYAIAWRTAEDAPDDACYIDFQNGPIKEVGVNGVTHEALLAIVIDRLRSFQAGPYACGANAIALSSLEEALRQLQKRTVERIARGVEGTHAH